MAQTTQAITPKPHTPHCTIYLTSGCNPSLCLVMMSFCSLRPPLVANCKAGPRGLPLAKMDKGCTVPFLCWTHSSYKLAVENRCRIHAHSRAAPDVLCRTETSRVRCQKKMLIPVHHACCFKTSPNTCRKCLPRQRCESANHVAERGQSVFAACQTRIG